MGEMDQKCVTPQVAWKGAVSMSDYESIGTVQAEPDVVFAYVSEVRNLPSYLPTMQHAEAEGVGRVHIQGTARGHAYEGDGQFRVDQASRRVEWGSEGKHVYRGWLQVAPDGQGSSVTIHLSFAPGPEYAQQLDEATGSRDQTIAQVLESTLASIRNQCEGRGGKVEPSAVQ
jgi:polyketide cyclase/dehydrase/lipid transport protein